MSERVGVDEVASRIRSYWWIPVVLAVIGGVLGVTAARTVPPVHRAEATVLVGPTQGAVTHSSTIRASEDLATFYADMARREIVLRPVVQRLHLPMAWSELRNQVSALVPPQNLRLVQVTVAGADQGVTEDIANGIVRQLATLSPPLPGGNEQAFVNQQVTSLKGTIEDGEKEVDRLKAVLAAENNPVTQDNLRQQIRTQQRLVGAWQRAYVALIAVEPSSDAGGLRVLDSASPVTNVGRTAMLKQVGVGAVAGGMLGLVIAWLLSARRPRRRPVRGAGDQPVASAPSVHREAEASLPEQRVDVGPPSAPRTNGMAMPTGTGGRATATKQKDGPR